MCPLGLEHFDNFPLPTKPAQKTLLGSLLGGGLPLALAHAARRHPGVMVIIARDPVIASKLEWELKFFLKDIPVLSFPDWETLPYDTFSPHRDIISERLLTLYQLPDLKKGILIVSISTLMHRLCPKDYLLQNTVWLKKGQIFDLSVMRKRLEEAGYRCVPEVLEHGEFAVRGSILDLFPMGSEKPFRIDLFDNEIDSIRNFEVETQRSLNKLEAVQLLPAREFPLNTEGITNFRTRFRDHFEGDPRQCSLYLDVSEGNDSPGLEYYLPLFFMNTSDIFQYCPENTLVAAVEDIGAAADQFWEDVKTRYDQYGHDRLRPILSPKELFLQPTEIMAEINRFPRLQLTKERVAEKLGTINLPVTDLPPLFMEAKQEQPLQQLISFLENFKGRVLFCVESPGRREVLKEILMPIACRPKEIDSWSEFLATTETVSIVIAPIEEGMLLEGSIAIITESVLLGPRVMQRRLRKARKALFDMEVQSLAELTIGAPVVHMDYGIGRYQGLTHLTLSSVEGEFVTLEYEGGDKLFVPVSSLHLISRYSGVDLEHAPLHRLGSEQWQKAKQKAVEQAADVAAELLEIYAHREAKKGFAFPKPDEHYEAFCAGFPFEETFDQQRAIDDVIADLLSDRPMDRVVCGDVGFGKTEVALRAAFIAVQGGKQVAVLVPTTLLAEQHFQTFSDRFSGFPIKIEVISRFRSAKEQAAIRAQILAGKIDILIGTHKILQEKLQFKSLGLLIIDEEHRFGVKQKEAFKKMRAEVDILTLTATPIPRTLNMAMGGLRDLSIIATPPAKRLAIKTFVRERQMALIEEAISRELHRGGQVYYLHNSIDTIEREAHLLETLIPMARIAIAHGQMPEKQLEQVMTDFYHRRSNVLVCTTIIETGIDIPTANTIIIDRADKFGLAQLHQLRGRVGRSHHQAYAYCLIPKDAKISKDAVKRLEALSMLEELGSGFSLATHDLEIRGAGELLGDSQSGNIQTIGFQLYMELLEEAVKTLRSGGEINKDLSLKRGVEIDLQIPAFIPESYIPDVHSRLVLYKRLSKCKNLAMIEDLSVEMIDRFGLLPAQTQNLFKITEIKCHAEALGIIKIDAGPKGGRFEFSKNPKVDPAKIIGLIQKQPMQYRLEGPQKLRFMMDLIDVNLIVKEVQGIINEIKYPL